jgi:hypothetical protein
VTGGLALSVRSDYDAHCCDTRRYDEGHTLAVASDVLLGLSVAAAITSVVVGATWKHGSRLAFSSSSLAVHF